MRISDWSADVCSSDLAEGLERQPHALGLARHGDGRIAKDIAVLQYGGPAEQVAALSFRQRIIGRVERRGADYAEIHHMTGLFLRVPHHHEIGRASCRERVFQYV